MDKIDFLEGPVYAAVWTGHGKKLLLCGDYHEVSEGCAKQTKMCRKMQVARLEHLIFNEAVKLRQSRKTLDVLVEYPRSALSLPDKVKNKITVVYSIDKLDFHASTYMAMVIIFLLGCFLSPSCSYHCYFHNVRLHAVDTRLNKQSFDILSIAPFKYVNIENEILQSDTEFGRQFIEEAFTHLTNKNLNEFKDALITYNLQDNESLESVLKLELENLKINKQFNKIKNAQLKKQLYSACVTSGFKCCKTLKKYSIKQTLVALNDIITKSPQKCKLNSLNTVRDILINWILETSWVVDAYVVGRIFSTFADNTTIDYAVVYLGDDHIKRIEKILRKNGMACSSTSGSHATKNTKQCIDFHNVKQPIFS